jgi:hypothetical protein
MGTIQYFKTKHPDLFEFIMFNILANIATITNFIVLNMGNGFLFPLTKIRILIFGCLIIP